MSLLFCTWHAHPCGCPLGPLLDSIMSGVRVTILRSQSRLLLLFANGQITIIMAAAAADEWSDGDYEDAIAEAERSAEQPPEPSPPAPPPSPPPAAPSSSSASSRPPGLSCVRCRSLSYSAAFHKAFGVAVCLSCRKEGAEFQLVTKTQCKDELLLTDRDLEALPHMKKKNPRQETWGVMMLFRSAEAERLARERHGDDLEAARERREVSRLERRIATAKRKREKERAAEAASKPLPARVRQRALKRVREASGRHRHTYGKAVPVPGEDDDKWRETCTGCGHERTFETM